MLIMRPHRPAPQIKEVARFLPTTSRNNHRRVRGGPSHDAHGNSARAPPSFHPSTPHRPQAFRQTPFGPTGAIGQLRRLARPRHSAAGTTHRGDRMRLRLTVIFVVLAAVLAGPTPAFAGDYNPAARRIRTAQARSTAWRRFTAGRSRPSTGPSTAPMWPSSETYRESTYFAPPASGTRSTTRSPSPTAARWVRDLPEPSAEGQS